MSPSITSVTEKPSSTPPRVRRWWAARWRAAVAGVAAVVAGLGVAELAAVLLAPTGSPLLVVGSLVIDLVPGWVKDLVIALFGTGDKVVLLVCLGILTVVLAVAAGALEQRRSPIGRILIAVIGVVPALAALTRKNAGQLDVLPTLVAVVVAMIVLNWLVKRARTASVTPGTVAGMTDARLSLDRRRFLALSGAATATGLLAAVGGRMLNAGRQVASTARTLVRLPKPAALVEPIPAGASLDVKGLSPLVTPNADFYRIDTALQVPIVDPKTWKLTIGGMVEHPITIGFDELIALPLEESYTTLMCVSNYVGGDLIGNAKWLGYPIRELLKRAVPKAGADMVLSTSVDGFTASSPLEALTDERNAILAVGMNGEPLPFEHGYPVRMVVPGLYGYVSATKWVVNLEVTTFAKHTAYWTDRGWSEKGPIKTSSRIDVPSGNARVKAGTVAVAGVAWAQHRGIDGVQVRVDNGPWNAAELGTPISVDTWRQWVWAWPATRGSHRLSVRAIDASGAVQTAALADVVPNGATGLHTIDVTVT
jgi:DMSO/TMAO reductase YedYZ molybdopterin-dependent catalytic subunit